MWFNFVNSFNEWEALGQQTFGNWLEIGHEIRAQIDFFSQRHIFPADKVFSPFNLCVNYSKFDISNDATEAFKRLIHSGKW